MEFRCFIVDFDWIQSKPLMSIEHKAIHQIKSKQKKRFRVVAKISSCQKYISIRLFGKNQQNKTLDTLDGL